MVPSTDETISTPAPGVIVTLEAFSLRISVTGGGCSGFTYNLGFDSETHESDTIIEHNDVKIRAI